MFLRSVMAWLVLAAAATLVQADFYVAPSGSDDHPGTQQEPFGTLRAARSAVRQWIARTPAPRPPVTVWIAAGTYRLESTWELTGEDSGGPEAPVTYRAEPGADVRLIGGRVIPPDAFQPVKDPRVLERLDAGAREHVISADLRALGLDDLGTVAGDRSRAEVFFQDQPLTLARWPNDGFAKIAEVTGGQPMTVHGITGDRVGRFVYEGDRPERWAAEPDVWLHGYWFWDWSDAFQKVRSIDTPQRVISLVEPYHNYGYRKGQRYYALNLLCELDQPGQWYLDRQTGVLYLWPPEPIERARVVFSVLESPLVALRGASHVVLRGLTLETTRGDAVTVSGGEGNLVAGCTIRNIGGSAVTIDGRENGVSGCDIYQIGASGIRLSGGDRHTLTAAGNYAVNNHIHHFGRIRRTYAAALHLGGVGNRAAHNRIHDAPHMAVGFGGNENVMEFNEIHDVCQETGDVGVFYTGRDWTVRGNVIRHNFIHHTSGPGLHGAQGIYLDDCASGTVVQGNVLFRVARAMLLGGGRDNVIENNVMVECDQSVHFDNRGLNWMRYHVEEGGIMPRRLAQIPYRQPPWSERYPQLLSLLDDNPGAPKGNVLRHNVIHRCRAMHLAPEVTRAGIVVDNLTTDEDLRFEDPAALDFRLRPDSPVFQHLPDFEPIPFDKIGLYIDQDRVSISDHRPPTTDL